MVVVVVVETHVKLVLLYRVASPSPLLRPSGNGARLSLLLAGDALRRFAFETHRPNRSEKIMKKAGRGSSKT